MIKPLVKEIPYRDPQEYFYLFSKDNKVVFLDSADALLSPGETNRYSYMAMDPFFHEVMRGPCANPFEGLKKHLTPFYLDTLPELPPFQGGLAGFFSYDLCQDLQNIPCDKNQTSSIKYAVGLYDVVISFDHQKKQAWIVSCGFPELNPFLRETKARLRLELFSSLLEKIPSHFPFEDFYHLTIPLEEIHRSFTKKTYMEAVKKVIQYITAGDIFEANLSQRFFTSLNDPWTAYALYCKLRILNPAPFAAYLRFDDLSLMSASPERFIQLHQGRVETRPIKGTRPRDENPLLDELYASQLKNSKKDHKENTMIVDLMRNDLSRVCKEETVKVLKWCELEHFKTVHHLISVITGHLKPEFHAMDLLNATFPGGSITGAPKIRAMEIIHELEPHPRGPYCGSMGFVGFDGNMDTSIIIRTFIMEGQALYYQTGGAVVYDSSPEEEYMETLHKARALTRALTEKITAHESHPHHR